MSRRLASLVLVSALTLSCKRQAPPAEHAVSEPPVPAPPGLVAEGTLRDPDAFWAQIHRGAGGSLATAPQSAAGEVLAWAGVDPSVAPLVADAAPFEVAMGLARHGGGLGYAIAMKLGDLAAVRAALLDGATARFRGEDVAGMLRLLPRQGEPPKSAAAVTRSGYLVLASSEAELATLGAYAARTLPTKTRPSASFELRVVPEALEQIGRDADGLAAKATGAVADLARALLPQEVDGAAVGACFTPDLREVLAAAAGLAEARVEANAVDGELHVDAVLAPKAGDGVARKRIAAMHPVDASPLLEAPRETLAALLWSDDRASRTEEASRMGPCLGNALAPILGPGGDAKLAAAMEAWARGRGDWATASFVARPPAAGVVVRTPVADEGALDAATRGFADLATQPSLAAAVRRLLPLRAGQGAPSSAIHTVDVPGVGKASVLAFPRLTPTTRDDGTSAPALTPPGLAWAVRPQEAYVALGQSPASLLALAHPSVALRSSAPIERAVGALGSEASFATVLVPPGCCTGTSASAAPLTLAWGRRGEAARGWLAIGDELLGELLVRAAQ